MTGEFPNAKVLFELTKHIPGDAAGEERNQEREPEYRNNQPRRGKRMFIENKIEDFILGSAPAVKQARVKKPKKTGNT